MEIITKYFPGWPKMGYIALTVALLFGLLAVVWVQAGPPYDNHAGLVVDYDNGTVDTFCLELANADRYFGNDDGLVTGNEVVRASGLPLEEGWGGELLCKIGQVGCPADNCFCQAEYWQYWHLQADSTWQFSGDGWTAYEVPPAGVEGWGWGVEPELHTFAEICGFDPSDTTPPSFPVNDPVTGTPLITPTLGITLSTRQPSFAWTEAQDNVRIFQYTLIMTGPTGFDRIITIQPQYLPVTDWQPGVYTWTVQAQDAAGNVSPAISPQAFELVSGANPPPVEDKQVFIPLILKNN